MFPPTHSCPGDNRFVLRHVSVPSRVAGACHPSVCYRFTAPCGTTPPDDGEDVLNPVSAHLGRRDLPVVDIMLAVSDVRPKQCSQLLFNSRTA